MIIKGSTAKDVGTVPLWGYMITNHNNNTIKNDNKSFSCEGHIECVLLRRTSAQSMTLTTLAYTYRITNINNLIIIGPAAMPPPLQHSKRGGPLWLNQTSPPTNSEKSLRGELTPTAARPKFVIEKLKAGAGAARHTLSKKVLFV